MKKIETKYIVAIIISIILGASILGYGYLDYRYKKEALEQQIRTTEQARIEKENKEQAESRSNTAKQVQLQDCLDETESNYSNQWYRECKSQGKLTSRCISLHEMTLEEYAKEKNIPDDKQFTVFSDFYKEKDECSCRLLLDNADRIEEGRKNDKAECFKKYPQ